MTLKPMIRNNICINCQPEGCKKNIEKQIQFVKDYNKLHKSKVKFKNVLVIGCSNGYGLATRVVASFGCGARTIGVSLERASSEKKTGTPGWYHNRAFEQTAKETGKNHITIEGDAFSNEIKREVIEEAKKHGIKFDLIVYSIASPLRKDAKTCEVYKSVIKPIKTPFNAKTLNIVTGAIEDVYIPVANEKEISDTIKVMGGEDWENWLCLLKDENLLSKNIITFSYSYIGSSLQATIYKDGTIGQAKKDLERSAKYLNETLKSLNGKAFLCVMKGIVTRSSAIIPSLPLYLSCLLKVMKKRNCYSEAIEDVVKLFYEKLDFECLDNLLSSDGFLHCDGKELNEDVQHEVKLVMDEIIKSGNVLLADIEGYRKAFLEASGFEI